jgi:integrase
MRLIPAPKKPQRLPVILSPEEVLHFLNCVRSRKHRVILTTCYAAGLRVSEAIALTPAAIDSKRVVIRVRQGKGQRDRYTMLSPKLLEILSAWWLVEKPKDWLFSGEFPGQHIGQLAVQLECRKARLISKIPKPITPHSPATPSPVTCSNKVPTSARFNSCSGIAVWPQLQNTCPWRPAKSAPLQAPWICCLARFPWR